MAGQLGMNPARMNGSRPHTTRPMSLIESNRKKDIRRLGPSVSDKRLVSRTLETGILEIHVRETMP